VPSFRNIRVPDRHQQYAIDGIMNFFARLRDRFTSEKPEIVDRRLRTELVNSILEILRDDRGIHVEDAISAAATVVGERCIDATGDFPWRDHEYPPGQGVFSAKANELICGDATGAASLLPKDSILGVLRSRLDTQVYPDAEFPSLHDVFSAFASRAGGYGGPVKLSIPEKHLPIIPPLQIGYQTRAAVDKILCPVREDKARCLRIATESLAEILAMVASEIDHGVALTLAIETINGMAKTAPITGNAVEENRRSDSSPTTAELEADTLVIKLLADGSAFESGNPIAAGSVATQLGARISKKIRVEVTSGIDPKHVATLLQQLQSSGAKKVQIVKAEN